MDNEDRFWIKVNKTEECWEWTGVKSRGYGRFWHNGKMVLAHRFSYELNNDRIASGYFVCHNCDNPSCVNPKHLFVGTNSDNMIDCVRKGRFRSLFYPLRGEKHPFAKLSDTDVECIRADFSSGLRQSQIADKFGISKSTVFRIVHNQSRNK